MHAYGQKKIRGMCKCRECCDSDKPKSKTSERARAKRQVIKEASEALDR